MVSVEEIPAGEGRGERDGDVGLIYLNKSHFSSLLSEGLSWRVKELTKRVRRLFPDAFSLDANRPDYYSPSVGFIEVIRGYRRRDGAISIKNEQMFMNKFGRYPMPLTVVVQDANGNILEVRRYDWETEEVA